MYKKRHKENTRKSVSTNTDSEGKKSSNPDENGSQVENWTLLYLLSVDQ